MELDIKVFQDILSRAPSGRRKYIFIVRDTRLVFNIMSCGFYSWAVTDSESAEKFITAIANALIGGYVREYIFILPSIYGVFADIRRELDGDGVKTALDGWKIFKDRDTAFAISEDTTELKTALNGYIDKLEGTDKKSASLAPISAAELQVKAIPPAVWYVDRLIPAGETILTAPSKFGKSWLSMDMSINVANGMPFLGRTTQKSGVLYLALEDSERRLKQRMNKLLNNGQAPSNLYFLTKAGTLDTGLIDQLKEQLREKPDIKVIIIDTFQKIRGNTNSKNMYGADYNDMGALKDFADSNDIAVMLIHHNRKMRDDGDVFNQISGSTGIMGAADTIIVLTRDKRDDKETKMHVTGRDVNEEHYVLEFNKETCRFRMVGDVQTLAEQKADFDYRHDNVVLTIKDLLNENGSGWQGTAQQFQAEMMRFGRYPADTSILGRKFRELKELLYEKDNIIYTEPKNSRTRVHKLTYSK